MSAEILRQRVQAAIVAKRKDLVERVTKVRFVQSGVNGDTFLPHVGAEQIGLTVIDANAEIRAYDEALSILAEQFKILISPQQSEAGSKGAQPDNKEHLY